MHGWQPTSGASRCEERPRWPTGNSGGLGNRYRGLLASLVPLADSAVDGAAAPPQGGLLQARLRTRGAEMRDRPGIGWWLGLLVGWPIWLLAAGAVAGEVTGGIVGAVPFAVPALANRAIDLVVTLLVAYMGARILRALKAPQGIFTPLVVSTILPLAVIAVYSVSTGGQLDLFAVVYEVMYLGVACLGAWLGASPRMLKPEAAA